MQNINCKKSAGPDGLDSFLLKLVANIIVEPITYIFNLSLEQNIIPRSWKTAHVTPLFKNGDPTITDNYRPISKLSLLVKILGSLVSDQLKDFLTVNNILIPSQSGFRKGYSTITAATKVVDDIVSTIDCKESCAALFVDLSKAFDTVDHTILLKCLSKIGMSVNAIEWFKNYLSSRYQCVTCEGIVSGEAELIVGVPQGSILGPLLFTIYINDICTNIDAAVHLYADDTIIYSTARSPYEALNKLQDAFITLQKNLFKLKLVLNL